MARNCVDEFARKSSYGLSRLIALLTLSVLAACQPTSAQLRNEVEADLMMCALEASDMPEGWKFHQIGTYRVPALGLPMNALGGIRSEYVGQWTNSKGYAVHEILAYRTTGRAAIVYGRPPMVFHNTNRITPWLGFDLTDADLSADASRVGCAFFETHDSVISQKSCNFVARYGRFVTRLYMSYSRENLTEEELMEVAREVDRRMSQCADKFGDAVWEEKVE